MTLQVTWPQALAWRMRRQMLDPIGPVPVDEVVRRLGAVQAQVASSAELAIRVRRRGSQRGEVARALSDGRLVKTWAMRGTLHLLTPQEGGAFLSLMAAGRSWERPSWQRYFGMTPRQMERLRGIVREEIAERPADAGGADRGRRPPARLQARRGGPPLRLGHAAEADRLAGRPRLRPERRNARHLHHAAGCERALGRPPRTGRGGADRDPRLPRRVRPRDGRGVLLLGRRRLVQPGSAPWMVRGARRRARRGRRGRRTSLDPRRARRRDGRTKPTAAVRLLPGFDQFVLGPGTKDGHVTPAARRADVSRTAGWISPVVVVGGVVCGTWELDGTDVRIAWFKEAGRVPRRGIADEVGSLSTLLGADLRVDVRLV